MNKKKWSKIEEKYLINNHSDLTTKELSKKMGRSPKSISKKLFVLGLYKSKNHKSKMISKRNKMVGRDLSYEMLKKIAKKYKTRGEFQLNDSSAYSVARKKGYLNDICGHMFMKKYSIPQLILGEIIKILISDHIIYDSRKIIKPYELDIFIPMYNLAFEYDGKRWHKNNKNDKIKDKLCHDKKIKLIRIKENNRYYINDIKNQISKYIDCINKHCNLHIKKEDIDNINDNKLYSIINNNLLDVDDLRKIISTYNDYHTFIKSEPKIYNKLKSIKRLYEFTSHLKRNRENWTKDKILDEISKYEYLSDFYTNSRGCYIYVKRHKLDYILKDLKRKK